MTVLDSILGGTADDPDANEIEVTVGGDIPDDPDPEPFDPADIDDLEAARSTAEDVKAWAVEFIEEIEAEAERRARDERLDPFDIPYAWQRDASAYGEGYIEAALRAFDLIRDRGEASTEAVYGVYRRTVTNAVIGRRRFAVEFAPVLADAEGIEFRGYRVDPDAALTGDAIEAAVRERHYKFEFGAEAVAAAYRALLDGPTHGYTRLGLAREAQHRSNISLPDTFIGPDDPDDLGDGQAIEDFEFLDGVLSMPGVEPPDDPAWHFGGGESDE